MFTLVNLLCSVSVGKLTVLGLPNKLTVPVYPGELAVHFLLGRINCA
jgi:hypothetical protein